MSFQLPALPFSPSELAPVMSEETMSFHYGKHHKAYVDTLNGALAESPLREASLEEIVRRSNGPLFNNAAQAWNHTFFWHCLGAEKKQGEPSSALSEALRNSFGDGEKFLEEFRTKALGNFGSGWTWLVRDEAGKLSVLNTGNADNPLTKSGLTPLLVVDVWEHAYYIDYRNARKEFLAQFPRLVNWSFVSQRFGDAEVFNATKLMRA
jgi:Fe-Mn family superoxide dismutase